MNNKEYICPEILRLEMELEGILCESGGAAIDNGGILSDNDWGEF